MTLIDTRCYTTHMMTKTSHCARCGRILRDPKSIARGVGPKCAKRIAEKAIVIMARYSATQVDKAIELIGDAGILPQGNGTFIVVSSSGTEEYTTAPSQCTCRAGYFGRTCYHQVAAQLIAA